MRKQMKIFFEGDLQIYKSNSEYNKDSARFNAVKLYTDWVINNPKLNNKETIYFSLGDFFERALPSPEEYELGMYYLSQGKWQEKYILGGNHCYSRIKDTYSIQPFSKLKDTTLIFKPEELDIEGISCLCLPYFYDNVYSDLKPMKEEYESLVGDYDIIATHIQDENNTMFGNNQSINISKLKGQRIQGHLHAIKDNKDGYVNSPLANTKAEILDKRYCFLYDIETKTIEKIEIPNFLNYSEVVYPEPITVNKEENSYTLYTIREVTDKQTVIDFYRQTNPNIYIKEIVKKKLQTMTEQYESQAQKSILDFFNEYSQENKLNQEVQSIITELLPI